MTFSMFQTKNFAANPRPMRD